MYWSRDDSLLFGYDMDIRIKQKTSRYIVDRMFHTCKVWICEKMYEDFMMEENIPTYRYISGLAKTVFHCYGRRDVIIEALMKWKIFMFGI